MLCHDGFLLFFCLIFCTGPHENIYWRYKKSWSAELTWLLFQAARVTLSWPGTMCERGITKILQNKFEIYSCCFNVLEITLKISLAQKFSIVNLKSLSESIPKFCWFSLEFTGKFERFLTWGLKVSKNKFQCALNQFQSFLTKLLLLEFRTIYLKVSLSMQECLYKSTWVFSEKGWVLLSENLLLEILSIWWGPGTLLSFSRECTCRSFARWCSWPLRTNSSHTYYVVAYSHWIHW